MMQILACFRRTRRRVVQPFLTIQLNSTLHRVLALALIAALLGPQATLVLASTEISNPATAHPLAFLTSAIKTTTNLVLGRKLPASRIDDGMPQPERPAPGQLAPRRPPTKIERETKVADLELNPAGDVVLEQGQQSVMSAIPLDADGNAIHGLVPEWESSDPETVSITIDGQAMALKPGNAQLSAAASHKKETIKVSVIEAFGNFGDHKHDSEKKEDAVAAHGGAELRVSVRNAIWSRDETNHRSKRSSLTLKRASGARFVRAAMPMMRPNNGDDPVPEAETSTLYNPANEVGAPPGRTEPGAQMPGAAIGGTETPGSSNFSFGLPLVSLPGRGVDVSLGLVYNSRVWHKTASGVRFDVDNGWPAAGFKLGYGQIEAQSSSGGSATAYTLTDGDSTRHQLIKTNAANTYYETTDGTFLKFTSAPGGGALTYPDGTRVQYGAAGGGIRVYPTQIIDRNGNYILINYVGSIGPRISSIQDTMGRYVRFYYQGNDLVTITVPGYAGGAERQVVRFYYVDQTTCAAGNFAVPAFCPPSQPTTRLVKYIYFPGTQVGYIYDYSSYNMIYRVSQWRGMTVSTTDPNQIGYIVSGGQWAAETEYDYPRTPSNLGDVPVYTNRNDPWAGQTSARPVYYFSASAATGVSTVTAPDGSITETRTIVNNPAGQWNDGLVNETIVKKIDGTVMARTVVTWEHDGNLRNPRPQQVQITNEAGQIRSIVYTYTSYNNVASVSERGFDGVEMRRTESTYQTSANWTNRSLLRLPTSVKVFAGGSSTPISKVDYVYDAAGTTLSACPGIIMYADPATSYRGNVTTVKRYSDATSATASDTDTISYDVAGNAVSATMNCCRQKQWVYTAAHYYAYLRQEKKGDVGQLTTGIDYDFNTGVVRTTTDVDNNATTTYHYYPETVRLYLTYLPDGGSRTVQYGDLLYGDPDAAHSHSYVVVSSALDAGRTADEWQFMDGRGAVARTFGFHTFTSNGHEQTFDIEYDVMGRVSRTSNPYYAPAGSGTAINPPGFWTTYSYDVLGRQESATTPDGNVTRISYAGNAVTMTDESGRQRRQITDALGRLKRLDEPDGAGNLGTSGTPAQPTSYTYDALDNLVKITQDSQSRFFKYDSLSRLKYERHVEQDAPHTSAADPLTGNAAWSSRYEYNGAGLLQSSYDARNIQSSYGYDGLNRLTQIAYSDGTPTLQYEYDEVKPGYYNKGRLTQVRTLATASQPVIGNAFEYDIMGRVVQSRQGVGPTVYTMNYTYNYLGELATQSYPTSGRVVTYSRDDAARLSQVSDNTPRTYLSNLQYGAHGGLSSETMGTASAAIRSISYNNRLQPTRIKLTVGGAEKQRFDYSYGRVDPATGSVDATKNNGQIGRIEGYTDNTRQYQQRFSYTALGLMNQAKEHRGDNLAEVWQLSYSYDNFGNRYQFDGQSRGVPFTTVTSLAIQATKNRYYQPAVNVTYDAAGNILVDGLFRGMQFQYDANNRVKWSARTDGTQTQTSIYDGVGKRVQTATTSLTRQLVYDAFGQLIAEYEAGAWRREYVYRGAQLIATVDNSGVGVRYVMADHQGSTRAVLNSSGAIIARHDYLPFGEEMSVGTGMRTAGQSFGASDTLRRRYGETERDFEGGGIDHTWWRKYESYSGRWTSPDPYKGSMSLADPQSFNRYAYVQNDPVNFVDPMGLDLDPIVIDVIDSLGGVGGLSGGPSSQIWWLRRGYKYDTLDPRPPAVNVGDPPPPQNPTGPVDLDKLGPPPNPNCIMNAVAGATELARPFGNVNTNPSSPGYGSIGHDGVHAVARPGSRVTTLPALTGRVIDIRRDEDGTRIANVLLSGGNVAIYKDLVTVNVRPGQRLGAGAAIGTIGEGGDYGGLHFSLLRGGMSEYRAYRAITSGRRNGLITAGMFINPLGSNSPVNCPGVPVNNAGVVPYP